jgi:hypothetical protein
MSYRTEEQFDGQWSHVQIKDAVAKPFGTRGRVMINWIANIDRAEPSPIGMREAQAHATKLWQEVYGPAVLTGLTYQHDDDLGYMMAMAFVSFHGDDMNATTTPEIRAVDGPNVAEGVASLFGVRRIRVE